MSRLIMEPRSAYHETSTGGAQPETRVRPAITPSGVVTTQACGVETGLLSGVAPPLNPCRRPAVPLRARRPSLCDGATCPGRDSNSHAPEGTGGFKPPASAVPPPGRGGRG